MDNRNNINDRHSMKTAVWAAYFHLLSSNESPQHGLCPADINAWCKFQKTEAECNERSELIPISGALDHALNSNKDNIWILTHSRSSIQYLKNWPNIMDSTIISKLDRLGQRKQVCLQWIPSHVGVPGDEAQAKMNLIWRNPPAHHCGPGLSQQCSRSRAHQLTLARFRSGHLRGMTFVQGAKSFFTCPFSLPVSPARLLDC
ncbi:RNase H domain-containing protein [Trichonephila clavipes]|nr:RNase H domain-containing protein [Trichonephila clavipes]